MTKMDSKVGQIPWDGILREQLALDYWLKEHFSRMLIETIATEESTVSSLH
jgi:hypothetical protein